MVHLSQLLSLLFFPLAVVMDLNQNAKYPLHEAAREGKSELSSSILMKMRRANVCGSSTRRVPTECEWLLYVVFRAAPQKQSSAR